MLTIRHLNGALSGTDKPIEPGKERVVFGRALDCDVQYPPEESAVARHHFALVRRPSGSWTVELFGTPYVAVNGAPADAGMVVGDGSKIELGHPGGPSFTTSITADPSGDNYVATAVQAAAPSPRMLAIKAGTLAWLAAVVAIAIGVIGGVYAAYNEISTRMTASRLASTQKELAGKLAREADLRIGADSRERLARAVYAVQIRDAQGGLTAGGTAWIAGPDLLVTNAHVAVLREGLRPGEKMVVRAPGEKGEVLEVVSHTIHPGWVPFNAFLRTGLRLTRTYRLSANYGTLNGLGYDVALLRVAGGLPADARLPLATPDELENLASGSALGTAGYPAENMVFGPVQTKGVAPQLHVGVVTSVTDMFGLPADAKHRQLIQHDLPLTGGQSGSPIVGPRGNVVAVLNAMNTFAVEGVGRVPNAALVNFAQRADLVQELIDGTAEAKLAADRSYWQEVGKNFADAKDIFQQQNLTAAKPAAGMTAVLLGELSQELVASSGRRENAPTGDRYISSFEMVQKLAPGEDYFFTVAAEGGTTQLTAVVDDDVDNAAYIITAYHPFIACRLLTAAQQNTGDPKKPRAACVSGKEREAAMQIPAGSTAPRSMRLVVFNIRDVDDALARIPLKYTVRAYHWVADTTKPSNALLK